MDRITQTHNSGRETFTGVLTGADVKRNIPHLFVAPAGATQLRIRLSFSPHRVAGFNNMITLSAFDPLGFRGAGHRHGSVHAVIISAAAATPGFIPGPIPAGTWQITLDTHMVMPDAPVRYTLEVEASPSALAPSPQPLAPSPQPSALRLPPTHPRWYRGDLHAHTVHSDAIWTAADLAAWARAEQLDFVSLTDHNTVSGLAEMLALGGPDLLILGGMEFTTFWGHALMHGSHAWMDWRTRDGRGMAAIATAVADRGGTFIIAHPRAQGDPHCTGCRWVYDEVFPGPARVVEVWNTAWISDSHNEDGLALACEWLNAGYRMALTSGTDNHGRDLRIRYGFDHVYAQALTEADVLAAVRAGHLYLSSGPRLEITAQAGAETAMMGDALSPDAGAADVHLAWSGAPPGAQLSLIADGETRRTWAARPDGEERITLGVAEARWCLATLRMADGRMLALTNPVFLSAFRAR
jgi:hypothetical protein